VGVLHLDVEEGFVDGDHNLLCLHNKLVNGDYLIQSGLDCGDGGVGQQQAAAAAVGGDGSPDVGDRSILVINDVVEVVPLRNELVVAVRGCLGEDLVCGVGVVLGDRGGSI
jgi:hypothetical protein